MGPGFVPELVGALVAPRMLVRDWSRDVVLEHLGSSCSSLRELYLESNISLESAVLIGKMFGRCDSIKMYPFRKQLCFRLFTLVSFAGAHVRLTLLHIYSDFDFEDGVDEALSQACCQLVDCRIRVKYGGASVAAAAAAGGRLRDVTLEPANEEAVVALFGALPAHARLNHLSLSTDHLVRRRGFKLENFDPCVATAINEFVQRGGSVDIIEAIAPSILEQLPVPLETCQREQALLELQALC